MAPMRKESEVLLALKLFAKELGVPETIVTDAAKAETSREVKAFCINIGTTLKTLEEGMPWANLVELYKGLIKSSVGKDMKGSNWPLRQSSCGVMNNFKG